MIDFAKVGKSQDEPVNGVAAKLVQGERPVNVAVRLESARGEATFHLTRLEISTVAVSGTALDLMVKALFMPLFPAAHIGEPFALKDNVERIEVRPAGLRVWIKK